MDTQKFYAHGKILLTSEYFVIDGARAIALPSRFGQSMHVEYRSPENDTPTLYWRGLNNDNQCWVNTCFELQNLKKQSCEFNNSDDLYNILTYAKSINPNIFNANHDIHVTTHLEFPNVWGLGSSSTLISLIGQWLGIDPFNILDNIFGGSGYDIACASASTPIIYQKNEKNRSVNPVSTPKTPTKNIFFVHLNQKQDTKDAITHYKQLKIDKKPIVKQLNRINHALLDNNSLQEFENLITEHEEIISNALQIEMVKPKLFPDYWGTIKSLGAWGGDFALATSNKPDEETFAYFQERGYKTVLRYNDIIL